MKRKLTTILFADAQGYTALMATDEAATLERLNRYRAIMHGLFESHQGRQINTWGDAVIAEFSSVVEAVRCAVEIQDSLSTENHSLPQDKQMWFRIGINLGDVMVDKDDLYGDGVNVAQRLQSMAEPGGVMVSGTVHSLVHKQLALAFDFAGEQEVSNGEDRVPSYRVRMSGRNVPGIEAEQTAGAPEAGEALAASGLHRSASQLESARTWLSQQPRRVRVAGWLIVGFFALNLLFGGIANPWFIYPSAPLAIYVFLHFRRQQKRGRISPS